MPFAEFLKSQRLTPNVQHYIFHAIAMATNKTSTLQVSCYKGLSDAK